MLCNLEKCNSYYRVTKPFPIFLRIGYTDKSNTWVGRCQALLTVYRADTTEIGGIIINVWGGIFYRTPKGDWFDAAVQLNPQHIFEHGGRFHQTFPLECLEPCDPVTGPTGDSVHAKEHIFPHDSLRSVGEFSYYGRMPHIVYTRLNPRALKKLKASRVNE